MRLNVFCDCGMGFPTPNMVLIQKPDDNHEVGIKKGERGGEYLKYNDISCLKL